MDTYKIYGTGSYQKCTAPKISGKVLFSNSESVLNYTDPHFWFLQTTVQR